MSSQSSRKIRMAQYGTKHSHSAGVLSVTLANEDVEFVGVYEPDNERRLELQESGSAPWSEVTWLDDDGDILDDQTIVAVSSEGGNAESLCHTEKIIASGKNCFYDKPAGDDYARFERVVRMARERGLLIQLGYMFRYHDGFVRIADWARSGFLGDVFSIRAHMSTSLSLGSKPSCTAHKGGIFYDLASHMLDQIVWILGRPTGVSSFLRNDIFPIDGFPDNTLGVFSYDKAMALVDIAAMEPAPAARRFEVYGTEGSAIMEPFEPADKLRLCLTESKGGFQAGITSLELEPRPRYVAGLAAFIQDIRRDKSPDRSLDHELLVQETLLRATGRLP